MVQKSSATLSTPHRPLGTRCENSAGTCLALLDATFRGGNALSHQRRRPPSEGHPRTHSQGATTTQPGRPCRSSLTALFQRTNLAQKYLAKIEIKAHS